MTTNEKHSDTSLKVHSQTIRHKVLHFNLNYKLPKGRAFCTSKSTSFSKGGRIQYYSRFVFINADLSLCLERSGFNLVLRMFYFPDKKLKIYQLADLWKLELRWFHSKFDSAVNKKRRYWRIFLPPQKGFKFRK